MTLPKWNDHVPNEDACYGSNGCIAVSDGAGGCGLFANEWSQYLIEHLPKDTPISTFDDLDHWVDDIWEPFYVRHEAQAQAGDGMMLNKFYAEGSCATMAAAWKVGTARWRWMAYGDSVVFHYSRDRGVLEHSFTKLSDFSNPPRLISCKDPLEPAGFATGEFCLDTSSVLFVASDALAHYVMMMYQLSKYRTFAAELEEENAKGTANAQLLKTAETMDFSFDTDVLTPLIGSMASPQAFSDYLKRLYKDGVIDIDDYTLVVG